MGNVSAMSDDLREIVANMKAGRGTIGALLVDPSVYEDIKSLVGNVERNQVLRALVRYSIKQNEEQGADVTAASLPRRRRSSDGRRERLHGQRRGALGLVVREDEDASAPRSIAARRRRTTSSRMSGCGARRRSNGAYSAFLSA